MNDESPTAPKPRRRWLQFSLRTMMLVMVPVACVSAWVGSEYRKGLRQKAAIAWVEEMGGRIWYDDEATQKDWRRRVFGEWFPESVRVIDLGFMGVTDIAPLAELENLQWIYLNGSQVSDLTPLAKLENLKWLILIGTQVTDLEPLAELENLQNLYLQDTQVTDLTPLVELENLNTLFLTGTQVSDEQVQALQQALPNCDIQFD